MIRIGVTGGIGSGKSIVCRVFSALHVPVYNADEAARNLTDTHPLIREQLTALAGDMIYNNNLLNRPMLAELIFNDARMLQRVNSIIHPAVSAHFNEWCESYRDNSYIIHESAILFESNTYNNFDKIVAVAAPENLKIQRVMSRKNMTEERIRSVMANQLDDDELIRRSDFVIVNDDLTLVIPQVLKLNQAFLSLA